MKLKTPKAAPAQAQAAPPADSESLQTLPFPQQDQQQHSPADEAAKLLEAKPEAASEQSSDQPDTNGEPGQQDAGPVAEGAVTEAPVSVAKATEENALPAREVDHIAMYEQCLADATQRHLEAALAREALQGELKEAKDEEKAALKLVSKIKSRGPEAYRQAMQPLPTPITENTAGGDAGKQPGSQPSQSDTPPAASTDESWKSAKLEELNLKPALHEKLIENGIATLGDLENLRMQIADNKKDWPKGIGEAKITAIENAVVDWLSKNRGRQVVAEKPGAGSDSQPPAAPAVAAEPDSSPLKYPSQKSWDSWSESQQTKWIEARAKELEVVSSPPEEGELPAWQKGYDDFFEGDDLQNCTLPPGQDMDLWIRGWQAADAEGEKEEDQPEEQPGGMSSAASVGATSLDDLLA